MEVKQNNLEDEQKNVEKNKENPQDDILRIKRSGLIFSIILLIIMVTSLIFICCQIGFEEKENTQTNSSKNNIVLKNLVKENEVVEKYNNISQTNTIELEEDKKTENIVNTVIPEKNTIQENNTVEKIIEDSTSETIPKEDISILTEKQSETSAQETLKKYLENNMQAYENSSIGPSPYVLSALNLETNENLDLLCSKNTDNSDYIKSNTKYTDFKNALLQYISEEYFNEKFSQYKNIDGYVGFCDCAGGFVAYGVQEVKFKSRNNDIYNFELILIDKELYEHYTDYGESSAESDYLIESEISFKLVDGKLCIHKFL